MQKRCGEECEIINGNTGGQSLTFTQTAFILTALQIDTGIALLPRQLARVTDHGGWISLLLGGAVYTLLALIILRLARRFPGQVVYDYLPRVLGRPAGLALALLFAAVFLLPAFINTRYYVDAVQIWSLPRTPTWVLNALTIIPGAYLARFGIQAIARFAEFYMLILLLSFFMIASPAKEIDWGSFLPLFDVDFSQVLSGTMATAYSFGGVFILLLAFPRMHEKRLASRAAVLGLSVTTFTYLLITVMSVGILSTQALSEELFPVLTLISLTRLEIIQRLDVIFLYLNLITVITTQAAVFYMSARALQTVTGYGYEKFLPWLGLVPFFALFYRPDIFEFDKITESLSYILLTAEALVPLMVLAIAAVRGIRQA